MAHSTYTTTQTGQERVLRESGAGWRPVTSLALLFLSCLSPHWHSCRRPPDPAGRNYLLTTAPLSLVPSSRVLVASLLLANQAQDIHLAATYGYLYHFCSSDNIANLMTAVPTLSSH